MGGRKSEEGKLVATHGEGGGCWDGLPEDTVCGGASLDRKREGTSFAREGQKDEMGVKPQKR